MEYSLENPSIDKIIDYCNDLLSDEHLIVYDFGQNGDMSLHIDKDEDVSNYSNFVDIRTFQNGEVVDHAFGIHVTNGELYKELERIFNNENLGIL